MFVTPQPWNFVVTSTAGCLIGPNGTLAKVAPVIRDSQSQELTVSDDIKAKVQNLLLFLNRTDFQADPQGKCTEALGAKAAQFGLFIQDDHIALAA